MSDLSVAPADKPKVEPAKLVAWTDPVLWNVAAEVTNIVDEVLAHLEPMREAIRTAPSRLLGIAAPQVGIPLRFFVTAFREIPVVINPSIPARAAAKDEDIEGCASFGFPIKFVRVKRARWVVLNYTDGAGKKRTIKLWNLAARVVQHGYDHLQGVNIHPKDAIP